MCVEVRYKTDEDVSNLVFPLIGTHKVSNFALCEALNYDGSFQKWYAHPERGVDWFLDFCQCSRREDVIAVGGFDEEYKAYGFDDDDFSFRMQASGVKYQWASAVTTQHQCHEVFGGADSGYLSPASELGRIRYNKMKSNIEQSLRGPVANEGRDWGNINS